MFQFDPSRLDDLSRRQLMTDMAKYCLGVTVLPAGFAAALAAADKKDEKKAAAKSTSSSNGGKAKHLIYLYMQGAMSQLDTFDPKPKSKVQGDTKPIQTKISGVQFGDKLPELAKIADKLAVIRSMNTSTAAHEPARYLLSTSYKPIATTRHPGLDRKSVV